jgi:transcriptional repressor NrdR
MKCIYCEADTKVIETRETSEATRRRRECTECGERFTTYEKPELNLAVIKKNDRRVSYEREKIKQGMLRACEKRPVTEDQIDHAIDEIELTLRQRSEVPSKEIGRMVLDKLKQLDKVAYIRFASVYREFSDVASFESELKKIVKTKEEIQE